MCHKVGVFGSAYKSRYQVKLNRLDRIITLIFGFELTVLEYYKQVLLLKSYLQSKGLKDVYTGGLGSFSLTIMLVFYLEVCHRYALKCETCVLFGISMFV